MFTYAVIGYGGRGGLYVHLLRKCGEKALEAVCDIDAAKLDNAVRDTWYFRRSNYIPIRKSFLPPASLRTRL